MLSVFKFNFTKSPFDLNEDYDRLSDIDNFNYKIIVNYLINLLNTLNIFNK